MKEELQKALRSLEKNLKDIQSANETVQQVRDQAKEHIVLAGNVINKVNTDLDEVNKHFYRWMGDFSDESTSTFNKFESKASEAVRQLSDLNDTLKKKYSAKFDSLTESNTQLFQKYESDWEKHNQEINRLFLRFGDLRQTINHLKEEINEVDFHKKLKMISGDIEQINQKQKLNQYLFGSMGVIIIVLLLVLFILK